MAAAAERLTVRALACFFFGSGPPLIPAATVEGFAQVWQYAASHTVCFFAFVQRGARISDWLSRN